MKIKTIPNNLVGILTFVLITATQCAPEVPVNNDRIQAEFRRIDAQFEKYKQLRDVWEFCIQIAAGQIAAKGSDAPGDIATLALSDCSDREVQAGTYARLLDPTGGLLLREREEMRATALRQISLVRTSPKPAPPLPRT